MIRTLMILCAAGTLSACATTKGGPKPEATPPAITPTEKFAITVAPGVDEIMLAPHRDGLSANQAAALDNLVDRWRDAGGGDITVQRAPEDSEAIDQALAAVQTRLGLLGVGAGDIRFARYAAGERPGGAIVVSFTRDQAHGPTCGRDWKNIASSKENEPNSNFGCAVTANIAAMVANPSDLVSPRPMDPSDATRRDVVIQKYRKGDIVSSAKDDQATGSVK